MRPSHRRHAGPRREQRCKKGGDIQVSTAWLDNWTSCCTAHTFCYTLRNTEFAASSLVMLILRLWPPALFVPVCTPLVFPESVQSSSGCSLVVYLQLRSKQAHEEINSVISVEHSLKLSLKDLFGQHHFVIHGVIHHVESGIIQKFR